MTEDDELDTSDEGGSPSTQKRKKLMILLLPLLIVIGISVGVYFTMNRDYDSLGEYNVVQYNKDTPEDITVFYDLPELKASVKGKEGSHELRLKINLELSNIENLKIVEILTPKLTDSVLSHIVELNIDEVDGSTGLYWLKEELLYRLNLVAAPVKIKNLNFSVFELQK